MLLTLSKTKRLYCWCFFSLILKSLREKEKREKRDKIDKGEEKDIAGGVHDTQNGEMHIDNNKVHLWIILNKMSKRGAEGPSPPPHLYAYRKRRERWEWWSQNERWYIDRDIEKERYFDKTDGKIEKWLEGEARQLDKRKNSWKVCFSTHVCFRKQHQGGN